MMRREAISRLPKKVLVPLLEVCLRDLRLADALWFLYTEKTVGGDQAVEIDQQVWARLGAEEARRVQKSFGFQGDGVNLLIQSLRVTPGLLSFTDFSVKQTAPGEAVLQITNCYPQRARLRDGLGLFSCQGVDEVYFRSYAAALDPRLKVQCELCPPHKYSENLWCQWRFYIADEESLSGA